MRLGGCGPTNRACDLIERKATSVVGSYVRIRREVSRPGRDVRTTMREKSILIIGAGIGGLSTGCYARMNGYRATILEMHTAPGGLCTSWKRHGYTFDGSIHNLGGTSPDSAFHQMWRELDVVPALRMHAHPVEHRP